MVCGTVKRGRHRESRVAKFFWIKADNAFGAVHAGQVARRSAPGSACRVGAATGMHVSIDDGEDGLYFCAAKHGDVG